MHTAASFDSVRLHLTCMTCTCVYNRPVTTQVEKANEQLYGNEAAFFEAHLGPKLK